MGKQTLQPVLESWFQIVGNANYIAGLLKSLTMRFPAIGNPSVPLHLCYEHWGDTGMRDADSPNIAKSSHHARAN
jgi:hypothetical protein